jgi:UDP-galactopyranose mutase
MLAHPNITVVLNMDYESVGTFATYDQVIFTGRIDSYFSDAGLPQLEYRSLNFEKRFVPTFGYAQRGPVVNYPSSDIPHTRSVEYKWFPNCPVEGQEASNTIVVYETSCDYKNQKNNEPYYPVPSPINQALYERYKTLASSQKNVHFIGRLASYKYFNMDQAIRAALDYFEEHF